MMISDDNIIVNTQGIRYVHKWDGYNGKFSLGIQYKGSNLNYAYVNQLDRDAMFVRLQYELTKGNKK